MPHYLLTVLKGYLFIREFDTENCKIGVRPVIILRKAGDNLSAFFIEQATGSQIIVNHDNFFRKIRETPTLKNRSPMRSSTTGGYYGFFTPISFLEILRRAGLTEFVTGSALDQLFISFYIFNAFRDHLNLVGIKHEGRYVSTDDFERGYRPHIEPMEGLAAINAGTIFDGKGNMAGLFDGTRFTTTLVFQPT